MTFQEAVRTVLQQKYATFDGRARRSEFWFFVLFSAIVRAIANVLDAILHIGNPTSGGPVSVVVTLALLVPSLAVGARRLHDTGRSGWWWLIALIPIVGIIILVVLWAQDSHGDNQYGPNPKGLGYGQGYGGYGQGYGGYGAPPAPPQGYGAPSPTAPEYGTPSYGTPPSSGPSSGPPSGPSTGQGYPPPPPHSGQDEPPTAPYRP